MMEIRFKKQKLSNGLTVIAHHDPMTPMVCVNVMYKVGSRNEDPERTGFAHLFEHLMFGGSKNIPVYDRHVEAVGGENNAFTNTDVTNYYLTVPAPALDTALWLESDRMLELAFSEEALAVQKSVVVEEFKQRYLNQPYGDIWMLLRSLSYQKHPYRWPAIGIHPAHIELATLEDVKNFFRRFYHPGNAVLSVAGNMDPDFVFERAAHWFGDIPEGPEVIENRDSEPVQRFPRRMEVYRDVPAHALYRAYPMQGRVQPGFFAADLLSDILSGGFSSRLYRKLVREQNLFADISAHLSAELEPGLFVLSGRLTPGTSHEKAIHALDAELERVIGEGVTQRELDKVKNKVESMLRFASLNLTEKALNLAYHEVMGDAALLNLQPALYKDVSLHDIHEQAGIILNPDHMNEIRYYKRNEEEVQTT